MRLAFVLGALAVTGCIYDYAALGGLKNDASDAAGLVDGGATDSPSDRGGGSGTGTGGSTGSAGGSGTSGSAGTGGRPNGAGCTSNDQCGSGTCAIASGGQKACCDGAPDVCKPCVGGYITPLPDGPTADGCALCTDGLVSPQNEGTSCGARATCGGPMFSSGLGDGSGLYSTVATNFSCHAGMCVPDVVNCVAKACPACNKQYLGCFVDSPGVVGGPDPIPGATCRCVDKGGSFCTGSL